MEHVWENVEHVWENVIFLRFEWDGTASCARVITERDYGDPVEF